MRVLNTVPFSLWDRIANACPYATFFHSSLWAQLLRKNNPLYKIATKAFLFGKDDWIVFPMMQSFDDLRGFFRSFHANIPGVYGGPIANHPLTSERVDKITRYIRGIRTKKIEIFGNPFGDIPWPAGTWGTHPNFTHVLKLTQFNTEADFLNRYTRGVRKSIKRAYELGYQCRPVFTEDDVRAYYGIYKKALERYGQSATGLQPLSLFLHLYYERGSKIQMWVAERNAAIIGGMTCFAHNKHFVAWHASFLDDEFEGGVAKFFHHRMILEAKKNRFEIYDFNPSGGHEGTAIFKDRFGTTRLSFNGLTWNNNRYFQTYLFLRAPLANLQKLRWPSSYPEAIRALIPVKEKGIY